MKIYLEDENKVNIYNLPSKIEDSFLINYISDNNVEETIALTAKEEKWWISSTPETNIMKDNMNVEEKEISDGDIYLIKFTDIDKYVRLYCFDSPQKYFDFDIGNEKQIIVSRDQGGSIAYNSIYVASPHVKMYKQNNQWLIEDSYNKLFFVNSVRVKKAILKTGDVIFISGLKIIWMNSFIRINNPSMQVSTILNKNTIYQKMDNKYNPVTDSERAVKLYDDSSAFFHIPSNKKFYQKKEISIQTPPSQKGGEDVPFIVSFGPSLAMGVTSSLTSIMTIYSFAQGNASMQSSLLNVLRSAALILAAIVFPFILQAYRKRVDIKYENKRKKKYTKYLGEKANEIAQCIDQQKQYIMDDYPDIVTLQKDIMDMTGRVWKHEITKTDFLSFRVGIGNEKADIEIKSSYPEFSMDNDKLLDKMKELATAKYILQDVPIIVSMVESRIIPLIIEKDYLYKKQLIDAIMLQIIGYHSGLDLKVVVFTNKEGDNYWNYVKYLPHCCSDDKQIHFYSNSPEEARQVSYYLENIYQERENGKTPDKNSNAEIKEPYASYDDYYLIITDDYISIKDLGIVKKILGSTENFGFSFLLIEPTMKNIPSRCDQFVVVSNKTSYITGKDQEENKEFKPDLMAEDIIYYAQRIANIPISRVSTANTLPQSLTFLEMYKVGRIEQLSILNRWKNNDPTLSLHTPIGVHEDGKLFELDLHEKFHGPHGLIAGSTGSGKSEFIITYILSMSINYHPDEVQFVIIDYKGGGLAGAFENKETGVKLPHLAGTITNLDSAEMNRTLVSINSELKRRQRMFNEARDKLNEGTIDIYKYQKYYREGKVEEPIPHLFIISDEFAELKAQQPDFMDELISTARIGRSLGVHLILATQKPAGVVNEQIWSNARFKIALKVQSTADSNDLLKRPEAAFIKETGRFYLQVGYDEIFEMGQSGWSGAKYIPTDRILKTYDDTITFIDNTGNIMYKNTDKSNFENSKDYGDQLTNIVKSISDLAIREKLTSRTLWLPSIPEEIFLSNIIQKYKYTATKFMIEAILGEYDSPAMQKQGLLKYDLTNNGNIFIGGTSGSGKENLIMTMLYSICCHHSTDEVQIYILDFGAEVLKSFSSYPQVGDIVLQDEFDKLDNFIFMMDREMNNRKELFAAYGGTYNSYISNSGNKLPLIIVVLNNYEGFMERYANMDNEIQHFLRNSAKYGIIFIFSIISTHGVGNKILQNFSQKILTRVADDYDYQFILDAPKSLKPGKYFGRGLATYEEKVYEFQTAFIHQRNNIINVINDTGEKLNEMFGTNKARKIPLIPAKLSFETLSGNLDSVQNIPLGISVDNGEVATYDLSKSYLHYILGAKIGLDDEFAYNLINILSSITDTKLKVFDFSECVKDELTVDHITNNFTESINSIPADIENEKSSTIIYLIFGIGYIYDKVKDEGIEELFKILNSAEQYSRARFILIDNVMTFSKIAKEEWYKNNQTPNGIWVGSGIDNQSVFKTEIRKMDASESIKGVAYLIQDNSYNLIKIVGVDNS